MIAGLEVMMAALFSIAAGYYLVRRIQELEEPNQLLQRKVLELRKHR